MCGIVAYLGDKEAYPILINGLKRLEYRGYDSAGVALLTGGKLLVHKCQGKVSDLEVFREGKVPTGTVGMHANVPKMPITLIKATVEK